MKVSRRGFLLATVSALAINSVTSAEAGLHFHGLSSGTALPQQANLVTRFSADSLALSNGASVTSWTDSINGIVAGTAVAMVPTFLTNAQGSKPAVRTVGTGGLSIATPGVLRTAVDAKEYTVFIAAKVQGAFFGVGTPFSCTTGGDSFLFFMDSQSGLGRYGGDSSLAAPYYTTNQFATLGYTVTQNLGGIGQAVENYYTAGGCFYARNNSGQGSGAHTFSIGTDAGNNFPSTCDIFEILVWNVRLTPTQMVQAEKWARDKYSLPYPWAATPKIMTVFGDSISQGVGAGGTANGPSGIVNSVVNTPAYQAAQTAGLPFGTWNNLSVGSIQIDQLNTLAPTEIDPLAVAYGKTHAVVTFEWTNQRIAVTTNGATYLAARKAIANQQTVWGTSTGFSGDPDATRNSYDAAWDALATPLPANADAYMAIHTSTQIGTSGAFAAHPANWSDTLHLSATGYPFLAAFMSTGFNALP